ncbi:MAG: VTT domain-containing protein [Akkermansiaceae bacterium]
MDLALIADAAGSLLERLENLADQPVLVFLFLALATYGSEDLACITGGLLAAKGVIGFPLAASACAVGIWTGDIGVYLLGFLSARGALKWKWLAKRMSPERMARGAKFFEKYGVVWIFLTRFMPGSRVVSYLAAGATGWSLSKFAITLALAAIVWTPLLCGAAWFAGEAVQGWLTAYEQYAWVILLGMGLLVWMLLKLILPMFTWRGRRQLYGKWLRLTRWEYWPSWLIYIPVGIYALGLSIYYRSLTLFTASVPSIPHSGFAMDSKGDILDLFDPEYLPKHKLLSPNSDFYFLTNWMSQENLSFPIVLKPNIGERGQGVSIIKNLAEAEAYLSQCEDDVIAQEFISGLEYGIYYQRLPSEERGRILSLSCKHPQFLTGDGVSTLEQLILNDPRAVAMAPYFTEKFTDQLDEILADGKKFALAEIGTHARGAVFTDDREDITADLTNTVDAMTQSAGDLYCGRYDVRVPNIEDLRAGENIKVLEFNGVTAEAAHIYQPGYPLWRGIADLCQQWEFIYQCGDENRQRGYPVSTLTEVIDVIREHRSKNWFEADDLG